MDPLLKARADPTIKDQAERSALDHALARGNGAVAGKLLLYVTARSVALAGISSLWACVCTCVCVCVCVVCVDRDRGHTKKRAHERERAQKRERESERARER